MQSKIPRALKLAVLTTLLALSAAFAWSKPAAFADTAIQPTQTKNPLAPTEKNIALGLDHFDAHCATCHASTGKADTDKGKSVGAADLTSPDVQSKSDKELFDIIAKGVPGTAMPAFGKTHAPKEIWHTVLFLRKLPTLTPEARKQLEAAVPPEARHHHGAGHEHQMEEHHHDDAQTEPPHEYPVQAPTPPQPSSEHRHEMPQTPAKKEQPPQGQMPPDHHHDTQPPTPQAKQDMAKMEHQHEAQPAPKPAAQSAQQRPPAQSEHAGHQLPMPAQNTPASPPGPAITLAEVERIALQNNPTLAQAEAAIQAAQGRKRQAGLWPNPVVGYQGEEFAFRAFSDKSEHFGFIEQTILLGGKLRKSQRIAAQEVAQAEIEAATQKARVLNTVRMLYYEALGAQQQVDLRTELARIARAAVQTTAELLNIGQADRPDHLESEIELHQVELELESARNNLSRVWQLLTAVIGSPLLEPMRLAGNLEAEIPTLDQPALTATLLQESPEVKRARIEVERAQAVLARARAERVPDLFLRGGIGYSREFLERRSGVTGRRTGLEANVQVGITLPIFNRNQGGIAAAQAEITIAERELTRLELALRVRLAQAFRDYHNALVAVRRYQEIIVPRAARAYNLYLASFRQMSASYPQVLISQRTLFQVREQYLNALVDLKQSAIQIAGFLLTGGLDAPRFQSSEPSRVEMTGVRSGSQGATEHPENRRP